MYGEQPGGGRCPGDGDPEAGVAPCDRWRSTDDPGLTWEQRAEQLKTCERCNGRAPLREEDSVPTAAAEDEETLIRVEALVTEQQAGRVISLDEVNGLEWQALVEWHKAVDMHRRAHEVRLKSMYELMLAQLTARR